MKIFRNYSQSYIIFKGIIHLKMNILLSFNYLYEFISSVLLNTNDDILKNVVS